MAIREHVLAVGTEQGTIGFLDMRKNELIVEFAESHDSEITQVI